MADVAAKVTLRLDEVQKKVDEVVDKLSTEIALEIQGQTQINIVDNNQVDTGFMVNSVYTVTPDGSGYGPARGASSAKNPDANMEPEVGVKEGQAAVVVGAEYAIEQELRKSFLYKAGEQVARRTGAIIERVGGEVLND